MSTKTIHNCIYFVTNIYSMNFSSTVPNYWRSPIFKTVSFVFIIMWIIFYYTAYDITDWWLENALVIIFSSSIFAWQRKFVFNNSSLVFIFLYLTLHIYGAKMAYTHNELGQFLQQYFNLHRNPYDRIVHTSFGLFMAYPMYDLLGTFFTKNRKYLFMLVHMSILCLATIFELIEWGVAVFTDSKTGESYVATQGDVWDAQKDIILASIGVQVFFIGFKFYRFFYKKYNQ